MLLTDVDLRASAWHGSVVPVPSAPWRDSACVRPDPLANLADGRWPDGVAFAQALMALKGDFDHVAANLELHRFLLAGICSRPLELGTATVQWVIEPDGARGGRREQSGGTDQSIRRSEQPAVNKV